MTPSKHVDSIISHLSSLIPVEEMRSSRGKAFSQTALYQVRIKPKNKLLLAEDIISKLKSELLSKYSAALGFTAVEVNKKSKNSGKFSSVSFDFNNMKFDVVVALGANRGETFEKELLDKMNKHLGGLPTIESTAAFNALENIDPLFKVKNIQSIVARTGNTRRSGNMTPSETGKIIADIIIHLKNGDSRYVSLKNSLGSTVANFGVSKAFTPDLKVNTESDEWKSWLKPFNLDIDKIENGLKAYESQSDVNFIDVETHSKKITESSAIFKLLEKLWGANYYYLREKGDDFHAMKIDENYVRNSLLHNLHITQIRYPSKSRKQIAIHMKSSTKKFSIELRNSAGKIRPTEIKFKVTGDVI